MQFAQRAWIEDFTFIFLFYRALGLEAPRDARLPAVRLELDEDLVPDEHLDAVQPHLPCQVAQNLLPRGESDAEQSIRQSLVYDALYIWCLILH